MKTKYLVAALTSGVFLAMPARAQFDVPPPPIEMLPCDGACAALVNAEVLKIHLPEYPEEQNREGVEGFVQLLIKVGEDGRVADTKIIQRLGPDEFASAVRTALRYWVYKPATLRGIPVSVDREMQATFKMPLRKRGARAQVLSAYRQASDLIRQGKANEAHPILDSIESRQILNLYERGITSHLRATIALQEKNYEEVRRITVLTLAYANDLIPKEVLHSLWRLRAAAAVQLGDISDAVIAVETLRKMNALNDGDSLVRMVSQARESVEGKDFLAAGRIPLLDQADGFKFRIYRRAFSFRDIGGKLADFQLSCRQQTIQSPITDRAEWSVPGNWDDCTMLVRGEPGTTFKIVQYANAAAPVAAPRP